MRLREPFAGYMLSSGHFMFHMAFLAGSYIAKNVVLKDEIFKPESEMALFQLNLAHIVTPLSNLVSALFCHYGYTTAAKVFDTFSIFQYQTTIFYAQYIQCNCVDGKLTGLNQWFIIEILAFYGYIASAMLYMVIHSIKSTMGWLKHDPQAYKHDFLTYHRKDTDWLAFVFILLLVNCGLIAIDEIYLSGTYDRTETPLQSLTMQLLCNHVL